MRKIDLTRKPEKIIRAEEFLNSKMVGHQEAKQAILSDLNIFYAGLSRKVAPIGARIFAGSSGVGKTFLAKLTAYILFDAMDYYDPETAPVVLINCSEYQERHEIAKLIGAPPGYVGHNDSRYRSGPNPALLAQENIERPHFEMKKRRPGFNKLCQQVEIYERQLSELRAKRSYSDIEKEIAVAEALETMKKKMGPNYSVIVFDEFEKAHPNLYHLLLQILGEGKLRTGENEETDFSNSFIFLTSNIGQEKIKAIVEGRPSVIGLRSFEEMRSYRDEEIVKEIRKEIKRKLSTELLGRFGGEERIVVFRPLSREEAGEILDLKLVEINQRLYKKQIMLFFSDSAKEFLLSKGYSELYGVRMMDKILQRYVVQPIAQVINIGDYPPRIWVEFEEGENLSFYEAKINYTSAYANPGE